jgi:hypothetical protein
VIEILEGPWPRGFEPLLLAGEMPSQGNFSELWHAPKSDSIAWQWCEASRNCLSA